MTNRILLLSDYSWAYLSSRIIRKYYPGAEITLITMNAGDVAEKHEFGMDVVVMENAGLLQYLRRANKICSSGKTRFDTAVIDYGFSPRSLLLLMFTRFKNIMMVNPRGKEPLYPITRFGFLGIFTRKLPYFVNKLLIKLSKKFRMSVGLGLPSEISIETTTVCNLKCRGCPTGLGQLNRPPQHIRDDLFGNITVKNRGIFKYLEIVYPFLYGEPLLNKKIFGYLHKLRSITAPYTRIELHTNGNMPNAKDVARKLVETKIDLVNVAVDGTDGTSYESFRRGGNFGLVCEFVRNLAKAKEETGSLVPEITVQMILTRYSEDRVEQFKKLKDELGAERYVIKKFFYEFTHLGDEEARLIAPTRKELVISKEEKEAFIKRKNNLCGWPYRSLTIMCNGGVAPCCIDSNACLLKGLSVYDSTVKEIWNSPEYRRFRSNMLGGRIELCNKCFLS